MKGVFGDLFDLDGDGSLDSTELGLDYAMADELIEEEKQKKEAEEASTEDEANGVVTVPITISYRIEEHKEQEEQVSEDKTYYKKEAAAEKRQDEEKGIDLKISLFSEDVDRDRLAELITENSKIKLSDAEDIAASATELSLHCRTAAEACYMKQKIETTGAKVELP